MIHRILIAALVLLLSAGPVLATQIGIDDQRVSVTAIDGDPTRDAKTPAVAQDTILDRHLVVWSADPTDGDFEIFGQMFFTSTGTAMGNAFRISPADADSFDAFEPSVAYSSAYQEYLVVWSGDHQVNGAEEIYAQRVDFNGTLVGGMARVSSMGVSDVDPTFDANRPDVAFDLFNSQWFVVWEGDDDVLGVDGEFELFGQRLDSNLGEIGTDDWALFATGGAGDPTTDSLAPTVAANTATGAIVVAFEISYYPAGPYVAETAIFSFDGATETPLAGPYLTSNLGASSVDELQARNADIAYHPGTNGFLMVYDGDVITDGDVEIYGQLLSSIGDAPSAPFAISLTGAPTQVGFLAKHPAVCHDNGDYLVTWMGKNTVSGGNTPEWEIYAQRLTSVGVEIGSDDELISLMGGVWQPAYEATMPAVLSSTQGSVATVVWSGDDFDGSLVQGEDEIYTQRLADTITAVETPAAHRFFLGNNTPNPFNPSTQIAFSTQTPGHVELKIYDVAGRLVRTLVDETMRAGQHTENWNGTDDKGVGVASGVYLYRLEAGENVESKQMLLVK